MLCFHLFFTRKDKGPAHDDKVYVSSFEGSKDIFEVKYFTPDLRDGRMFLASFSGVLQYIEDTLTTMRHDIDPFENIQVSTSVHPSILYHVSDMDESTVRDLILDTARDAMRFDVRTVS